MIGVALCNWNPELSMKVSFGHDQVLINYYWVDTDRIAMKEKYLLGDHPFIWISVESKGLDFGDVVVVFDNNQKFWDV